MSRITPPLKWHGGKFYLAPRIVALMPPHTHYVEPYFGGGSVLLTKNPDGVSEVANDLNRWLINFWEVLRDDKLFAEFTRQVQTHPFSEESWRDAETYVSCRDKFEIGPPSAWTFKVHKAIAFFIRVRQSLAGRGDHFAPLSRNRTRGGMNEQASAWLGAIDGLPAVHARLRRVVILNGAALDVIRMEDGPNTLFYLDPPYLQETRASPEVYDHEMTAEQHVDLCTVIRQCKGKVLLSGYPSELYRFQLEEEGWQRKDFTLPNNSAGGKTKRKMVESVWANFKLPE